MISTLSNLIAELELSLFTTWHTMCCMWKVPDVLRVNCTRLHPGDRLVGLVVRRPPRERKIQGSNPACAGMFSGSSHTSDLKIGTPVATLPGTWRCRVSTGTGRPGVSILRLGEVERLICNFYHSVAARKIVWAGPSLGYTRWDGKQPTNKTNCALATSMYVLETGHGAVRRL